MIDLRSDTLTQPTEEMRQAMAQAVVGDDGRTTSEGYGEDPTVRELEKIASEITGKEDALFCNSGTMANYVSLLTHCTRGNRVLMGRNSHIYRSERAPFMDNFAGLKPIFYKEDLLGEPDIEDVGSIFQRENIRLLCLENTNNYYGGTCISLEVIKELSNLAREVHIPIHLDGARIFHAAYYLGHTVSEICTPFNTVMFCLSKGLGAPIGSLLCGNKEFIREARKTRKLLGGNMRQSGIIAAAGIVALRSEIEKLEMDHQLAQILANKINCNNRVAIDMRSVQTNIVRVDVSKSGYSAMEIEQKLLKKGLRVSSMDKDYIRMVIYRGINKEDVLEAANIFNEYILHI